nr:MAG TPA: hypothetical protein [Caudoviricetes sp.]
MLVLTFDLTYQELHLYLPNLHREALTHLYLQYHSSYESTGILQVYFHILVL